MVSWLDCVDRIGVTFCTVAVTRTEVATVPPWTTVWTLPLASLIARRRATTDIPPTVVFNAKLTVVPTRGPPAWSRTRKITVEVSGWPELPVPRNAMFVGVADTKMIEPITPGATVTVPVAVVVEPLTVAVR